MSHTITPLQQKKIGRALKQERKEQDVDRETLAETLDVSVNHVKQVERGNATPSIGLLVSWSHVLAKETHVILRDAGV